MTRPKRPSSRRNAKAEPAFKLRPMEPTLPYAVGMTITRDADARFTRAKPAGISAVYINGKRRTVAELLKQATAIGIVKPRARRSEQ